MDPAVWESQIGLWDETGQFSSDAPGVEDVMTEAILDGTEGDR
jgi:hypothetical protein